MQLTNAFLATRIQLMHTKIHSKDKIISWSNLLLAKQIKLETIEIIMVDKNKLQRDKKTSQATLDLYDI